MPQGSRFSTLSHSRMVLPLCSLGIKNNSAAQKNAYSKNGFSKKYQYTKSEFRN
jgi:hypothetical protein